MVASHIRFLGRQKATSEAHLLHLHEAENGVKSTTFHSLANTFLKEVASRVEPLLRVSVVELENLVKRRFSHFAHFELELPLGEGFFQFLVALLLQHVPQEHQCRSTEFKLINSVSLESAHLNRKLVSFFSQLAYLRVETFNIPYVIVKAELSLADSLVVVLLEHSFLLV